MEGAIHRSLQTFLDGLALDTAALVASQKNIEVQLTKLAG